MTIIGYRNLPKAGKERDADVEVDGEADVEDNANRSEHVLQHLLDVQY